MGTAIGAPRPVYTSRRGGLFQNAPAFQLLNVLVSRLLGNRLARSVLRR